MSRASSLSDSELISTEVKPKYKRKKRKSKLLRFKKCAWTIIVVRKLLRSRYRKRKLAALNRSLYSGLCYQSSPREQYDNDSSGSCDILSQRSMGFEFWKFLFHFFNFCQGEKSSRQKKGKDHDSDCNDSMLKEVPRSSTTKIVEFSNFTNIVVKRKKKKRKIQKITLEYLKQCVFFRSAK